VIGVPVDENQLVDENTIKRIKDYTHEVFRQFPEEIISFGKLLSKDEAERFIRKAERNQTD
jgi:hypothetical protein